MRLSVQRLGRALATFVIGGVCACGGGGSSPNPRLGTVSFTDRENAPLQVQLTATDPGGSQLTFKQNGNPASGTVSNFTAAGTFTYQPKSGFIGSDSFSFQVADTAGHTTMGVVSITVTVDHPPVASNTIVRADDATAQSTINVLANASDPDMDKLTVSITQQPLTGLGTVSVNSDGTVSLTGLRSGFKGLTTFSYQVADPSGMTATAHAVIFVGADPFRATFAADSDPAGSGAYEVYLTDFAASPAAVTKATQGNMRLQGYAAADNGATIVYRTQDTTSAAHTGLAFAQSASPASQVSIPLPAGAVPVQDGAGRDQYGVSPDGNWIALIAGSSGNNSLYVLNVASPTTVTALTPSGAVYASQPRFSPDSKSIYFLAGARADSKSLYFAMLGGSSPPTLVSALSDPAKADDVLAYSVGNAGIVEEANRNGGVDLFYIDPQHLTVENKIDTLGFGQSVTSSTVGLPAGLGGSSDGSCVAYTVANPATPQPGEVAGLYVANVSTTPAPAYVAPAAQVIGLRPDNQAVLYTDGSQASEGLITWSGAACASAVTTARTTLGPGTAAWYDSGGNIVSLDKVGGANASALASTVRPFPISATIAGNASDVDPSGAGQGVLLFGLPAASATTVTLQLVNAEVPATPMPITTMPSPIQFSTYVSKVVSK